jgi:hypothetical protein
MSSQCHSVNYYLVLWHACLKNPTTAHSHVLIPLPPIDLEQAPKFLLVLSDYEQKVAEDEF